MTVSSESDRVSTVSKDAVPVTVSTVSSVPTGDTVADGHSEAPMSGSPTASESEDDLAAALAASAEQRIRQQIAAARQRRVSNRYSRAAFTANRGAGIRARHATKAARARLTERHQTPPANPADSNTHNDQEN